MKKGKEKSREELELLKNQLARALADYDNLRKRVDSEKDVWEKVADSKAALKVLPVLDMLLNSQKHLQDSGLAIIIKEFEDSLYSLGIEKIDVKVGDKFDPRKAEAIETLEGDKSNTVAEVTQTGWKMKNEDFVLRPTKVKVYQEVADEKEDKIDLEKN